ncbi:hypothetical protein EON82_03745 [bacterium]|nr:MAG: hypothetical protein EON82_03745 [bacterium]
MRLPTDFNGESFASMDDARLRMVIHELCFTERERLPREMDKIVTEAEYLLRQEPLDVPKFLQLVESASAASPEWHAAMSEFATRQRP